MFGFACGGRIWAKWPRSPIFANGTFTSHAPEPNSHATSRSEVHELKLFNCTSARGLPPVSGCTVYSSGSCVPRQQRFRLHFRKRCAIRPGKKCKANRVASARRWIGRAARAVNYKRLARRAVVREPSFVKRCQQAESAFGPRFQHAPAGRRSPLPRRETNATTAVRRFGFAVELKLLVEAEFGAEIIVKKLAAFGGFGDSFQTAKKSQIGCPRAVNLHRQGWPEIPRKR